MENITNEELIEKLKGRLHGKDFNIYELEDIIYITYSPSDSIYNSEFYDKVINELEKYLTKDEFESFIILDDSKMPI